MAQARVFQYADAATVRNHHWSLKVILRGDIIVDAR